MKRERRNNRIRHHGGRPPPDLRPGGYAGLRRARTEEVGLTLTPPPRYRSLLVPLDGTSFGEHALPLALGLARRAGAGVRLVNVYSPLESALDPGGLYHDGGLDAWLRRGRQEYLDGVVRRLARVTPVPVAPLRTEGRDVAASLCEAAGDAGADLVVMATHGRGLLGRLWHGGIADALIRRLTAPLLLVRGHDGPVDLTGDPAPRHVLVPLDGSEAAEQAVGPALELGSLADAHHTLLRVVRSEFDYPAGHGPAGTWRPAGESAQQAEARAYLRRLAEGLGRETAPLDARLLVAGQEGVAEAILWYAQERGVDLIALTTRGRGPLSRLFRGSVADQVVRRAGVPVLVVRKAVSRTAPG